MTQPATKASKQPGPEYEVRNPVVADASEMYSMAKLCGLDVNSEYSYLMVCHYFSATSAVATDGDRVIGYISGFRPPESPSDLFVWQIAVSPEARGRGVAGKMLDELVERLRPEGLSTPASAARSVKVPSPLL